MQKIVSVLIPLYNHQKTVERTLESILKSDPEFIELIVADDNSSDHSFDVAAAWIDRNGSVFYSAAIIKHPSNLGITGNLNWLKNNATGDYITLLASDDELTPMAIDIQKRYLESNPGKDFVFSNMGIIDYDDNIIKNSIVSPIRAKLISISVFSIIDLIFNWGPPWPRLFARREAFERVGDYIAEHSFEDRWSALKIAETRKYGYCDHVVHLYRTREVGLATGGIDPSRLIRDMQEVEKGILPETTGLLRACLHIRVKSFTTSSHRNIGNLFWVALRKLIEGLWKCMVGDWRQKTF